MGVAVVDRAKSLYKAYWTPGQVLRPTSQVELRWIYGAWLLAFCAKVLGSSWDVTWHFKWLRDNLAPPHLINSAGTALVIALVVFHTFTGYGVDRVALRWMQAGIGVFIFAVPIDIANHELNGLDLTAWSPSHMMLYVGTAIMIVGVLRGWWVMSEPGRWRVPVALALFFFSFENILFPNTQQDYGILSLQAWERGSAGRRTPSRSSCSSPLTSSAGMSTARRFSTSPCRSRTGCIHCGSRWRGCSSCWWRGS